MGIIKRLYLCDRNQPCVMSKGCSINGGPCRHTIYSSHAKTGGFTVEERDGHLVIPDNVKIIGSDDGDLWLVEEEDG